MGACKHTSQTVSILRTQVEINTQNQTRTKCTHPGWGGTMLAHDVHHRQHTTLSRPMFINFAQPPHHTIVNPIYPATREQNTTITPLTRNHHATVPINMCSTTSLVGAYTHISRTLSLIRTYVETHNPNQIRTQRTHPGIILVCKEASPRRADAGLGSAHVRNYRGFSRQLEAVKGRFARRRSNGLRR